MIFNQKKLWSFAFLFLLTMFIPNVTFAHDKSFQENYILTVDGEVATPLRLSMADLDKLPVTKVKATPHNGKEGEYSGVALIEILKKAGVKLGEDLRGKALANYLLVEASDGYQVIFALPEIDTAFTDRVILLANKKDDTLLSGDVGPLQIIVPGEKRHARWIRQVKSLIIKRPL